MVEVNHYKSFKMIYSRSNTFSQIDLRSRLVNLPHWLTRFIGYRPPHITTTSPPKYALYLWSFIGTFCSLALLQAIFGHSQYFDDRHVPAIVASFGASAILCYGTIDAPFAQPRALVGGHFLSAFIGVCLAKVFHLSFGESSNDLQWCAASLATALALVVMQATKTTHPPAGATALLPCIDLAVHGIGWYYLPVVLLSSLLILVTALLFNNMQRQYPKFWISPTPSTSQYPSPELPPPVTAYHEKTAPRLTRRSSSAPPAMPEPYEDCYDSTPPRSPSMDSTSSTTLGSEKSNPQIILWVPGRVRWTRTEDKTLHRLLKEGKSIDEIAEQFPGRTPAAIYQRSYMIPDLAEKQYNNVTPIHL